MNGVRVAVVGAGATGSPTVWGLTQCDWVSQIIVVDPDQVALSNLPRQPWYHPEDVGRPKVVVLAERLAHPRMMGIHDVVDEDFTWPPVDVVIDATDNVKARQDIEAWARQHHIPWIFSSALRWEGQVAWMHPEGPCLRCLFGDDWLDGPRCFEAGVVSGVTLAVAGQVIGLLERWQQNPADPDLYALWLIDGWESRVWSVRLGEGRCPHYAVGTYKR